MVKHPDERLDRVYGAVSHAVRRQILEQLGTGPASVTQLADPFAMSLPAVSKHIRVLEAAGLVHRTIDGREHRLTLEAAPLRAAIAWLETNRVFWETRLDRLEAKLRTRRRR
jgi:DNA-binding transcriptional ArsR family regulator